MGVIIRVLIIDDEQLAITSLENKLKQFANVEVVKTFTNVTDFLIEFKGLSYDAVFLDIQMPRIDGLELAAIIKEKSEHIQLVFVTAYREYSLEAFEFPSLDYLLKPVSLARLEKTIDRLQKVVTVHEIKREEPLIQANLFLQCFDMLALYKDGEIVSWKSEKVRELFAYFIFHQGQPISPDFLIEILWPNFDLARGKANLHTNISMLRKFLNGLEIHYELTLINRAYIFKAPLLRCDYFQILELLDCLFVQQIEPNAEQATQAIEWYRSGLLRLEDYSWLNTLQSEIEGKLACYLQTAIMAANNQQKLMLYPRFISLFPLNEKVVKDYLTFLQQQHLIDEAFKVYTHYSDILENELNITPNFSLVDLGK